ncbi:CHAD domain-containing protein [Cupriavidus sp. YAF13]|uniref:CHAD domain-containing protein n=1 Tax=Cupriavidus sp. YAF13 TaxID=3233075 RepID=UPI003F93833A
MVQPGTGAMALTAAGAAVHHSRRRIPCFARWRREETPVTLGGSQSMEPPDQGAAWRHEGGGVAAGPSRGRHGCLGAVQPVLARHRRHPGPAGACSWWRRTERGVICGDAPESVRQMRVGLRRLCSVLDLFAGSTPRRRWIPSATRG